MFQNNTQSHVLQRTLDASQGVIRQRARGNHVQDRQVLPALADTPLSKRRCIASVLPDAVGAVTTTLLPFRTEGMASICIGVSRPNRAKKGIQARLSLRLMAETSL